MHEKLLDHVEKISAILAKNAKFGIYDEDDIKQEIFLLVLKAEPHYKPDVGDEFSFFFNYVKKRLITLKRDHYANPTVMNYKDKLKINRASEISEISKIGINKDIDQIDQEDLMSTLVDSKIPANLRLTYLKLVEGAEVNWHDKIRLITAIKNILQANNEKED